MPDPKSKARVARMLSGNFRPDDIAALFLYARDHCDGRETVAEIGHFVAHHNERSKGIITRLTREWFATARFHMARFGPGGPHNLDGNNLPRSSRDYLRIAAKHISSDVIMRETGVRPREALEIGKSIADRLVLNKDGTWALPRNLNEKEVKVVRCLCSFLRIDPAFKSDKLVIEFLGTLKSNGLISSSEIRQHGDYIASLVQLFAVASMHNAIVIVGDGTTTQLKARRGHGRIDVDASVPSSVPGRPNIQVAIDVAP